MKPLITILVMIGIPVLAFFIIALGIFVAGVIEDRARYNKVLKMGLNIVEKIFNVIMIIFFSCLVLIVIVGFYLNIYNKLWGSN